MPNALADCGANVASKLANMMATIIWLTKLVDFNFLKNDGVTGLAVVMKMPVFSSYCYQGVLSLKNSHCLAVNDKHVKLTVKASFFIEI